MNGRLMLALIGLSLWQVAGEWFTFPDKVASHFALSGVPDAWMGRTEYCLFHLFLIAILSGAFGLTPEFIRRLPVSMINLPHKEYWLAPERAEQSMERLDQILKSNGVLVLSFLLAVFHLVKRANLGRHPLEEGPFLVLLAVFAIGMIGNIVRLYRAFPKP